MLSVISHPASVLVFSSPRVLHAEHDKPLSHTIPDLVRSRAPRSGAISASFSLALSLGFRRGSVASAGGPSKPQVRALEFSLRSPISSYPRGPFTAPPSLSHRRTRHVMCIFFWAQSTDIHRRICVRIAPTRSAPARIRRAQTLPTLAWDVLVPIPAARVCVLAFHFRKTRPRQDLGTAGAAVSFAPSQTHRAHCSTAPSSEPTRCTSQRANTPPCRTYLALSIPTCT